MSCLVRPAHPASHAKLIHRGGCPLGSTVKFVCRTSVSHVVLAVSATASCLGKVDNLGPLDHSNHPLRDRTWNQITNESEITMLFWGLLKKFAPTRGAIIIAKIMLRFL